MYVVRFMAGIPQDSISCTYSMMIMILGTQAASIIMMRWAVCCRFLISNCAVTNATLHVICGCWPAVWVAESCFHEQHLCTKWYHFVCEPLIFDLGSCTVCNNTRAIHNKPECLSPGSVYSIVGWVIILLRAKFTAADNYPCLWNCIWLWTMASVW